MINWDEKPDLADRVVVDPDNGMWHWASLNKRQSIDFKHIDNDNEHVKDGWNIITQTENNDSGKHYRREYKGIKLDPYRILKVYEITDPAIQHAIKKLLAFGSRGSKSKSQDIQESIDALNRWLQMDKEDNE